jgi:hypothetical protein
VAKQQPEADDYAEVLASMSSAFRLAVTKESLGLDLKQVLDQASKNMANQYWLISVARKLRIDAKTWFDRPWHTWKFEKMLREFREPAQDSPALRAKVARLGRYSSMLEFGVIVNEHWYRRLRGAVVDGVTTHEDLRALLRRPTVWCGAKQDGPSDFLVWARGRLGFNCPSDGALLIEQFHPIARTVFMAIFLISAIGAVLGGVLVISLVTGPYFSLYRLLVLLAFTAAILSVSLASWWLGPSSTDAARRLKRIFNSP